MCVYISHVSKSKHDYCTIYNLLIHIPYLAHGLNIMQNWTYGRTTWKQYNPLNFVCGGYKSELTSI